MELLQGIPCYTVRDNKCYGVRGTVNIMFVERLKAGTDLLAI